MKLFINESQEVIIKNIYGFIKENSWELASASDNSIVAIKDQKDYPMNYIWIIEPTKAGFMVAFNFKYHPVHAFLLFLILIYSTIFLIYLILSLHFEYIKWSWMFTITSLILIIIPMNYILFVKPLLNKKILNKNIYDFFSRNLDVKVIDFYHSNSFWNIWFYLFTFITVTTLFTSLIYQSVIIGLMFSIVSILLLVVGTNVVITQSDEGMFARRVMLGVMTSWIFFTLISVLFITFTIIIHSVNICDIEWAHHNQSIIDVLKIIIANFDEFIFHEDSVIAILNPQHWNLSQFAIKEKLNSLELLKFFPLLIISNGIVIIGMLNRWTKNISRSTKHVLNDKGTLPTGVVSKTKAKNFFNFGIILIWLIGTLINITHFILSVSIVYWFFTDNYLFFPQLIFKLSWVKYFPQQYDSILVYILWYSLIFILIFPSLIITYNLIRTIYYSITNFLNQKKTNNSNKVLEKIVVAESLKEKLITPKIVSLDDSNSLIHSQKSIFSQSGTIFINPILQEKLSREELKVVIRHELGHLKNDINKLNLLKSLSFIGLFPFPFLCLLIDFVKIELEADKFALKNGIHKDTLQSSIIKMIVLKKVISSRNNTGKTNLILNKFSKMFLGIKLLLFDNNLLSYTYPINEIRLASLQTLDKKNE